MNQQFEAYDSKDKKWKIFYPLENNHVFEELSKKSYENLPDKVYGKICTGSVGFNPCWIYKIFNKSEIRIKN